MRPIVVRGGGDLATGTIVKLSHAGYPVIILECSRPTAIRREAAFCEAVYYGEKTVEDLTCRRVDTPEEAVREARWDRPVLLVDDDARSIPELHPEVLVDAILAKENLGTTLSMADLVIALGPGFTCGSDADFVVETMRGHRLGRVLSEGSALPNTGIPGLISGYGAERVIHAPAAGILHNRNKIADLVTKGEPITYIETADGEVPVPATLTGVLRGILPDGFDVPLGMKMADIDPRAEQKNNCFTVSDKARCIAGGVLELVSAYEKGVLRYERRSTLPTA